MPAATTVLGALTLALAVAGSHAKVIEAHSTCTVTAQGYTDEQLGVQRADAVNEATAYVCGGGLDIDATTIASATASAFAKAVTKVFVDCRVKGIGSASASGSAAAHTEGVAWLKAYASAWADAAVCDGCYAVADAYLFVQEDIFLSALSTASAKIDQYWSSDPNGDSGALHAEHIHDDIEVATVTAVAEALAIAHQNAKDEACFAEVTVQGTTPNNDVECSSVGVGYSLNKIQDAVATAVAKASDYTCDDDGFTYDDASEVVQDIARATTKAIAIANSECKVEGTARYVCATSDAEIDTIAIAIAEATATGWAGANTCNCEVGGDAAVSSLGGILVEAAASAWSGVCPDGPQSNFHETDFDLDVDAESDTAKALASALISMVPNGEGGCAIEIEVETSVCECAAKPPTGLAECKAADSDEVLSCCQETHVCAKSGRRGVCRNKVNVPESRVLTPNCLKH